MVYTRALQGFGEANIDWLDDEIRVTLHTSSYIPNVDTDDFFDDATNEISGGGYTTGGYVLASKAINHDTANNRMEFDAADVSIASLTNTFRYIVVRKFNATASLSRLICYIDLGADIDVTGAYTITWNADGVFQLRSI